MNNPYQPPLSHDHQDPRGSGRPHGSAFLLAAAGAWLAAAYWAALTLLITFGVAAGSVSPLQIILPSFLIALYVMRGVQVYKGNASAATSLMWLHGIGGAFALMQMFSGTGAVFVLQAIKIAIHLFGGVMAYRAKAR